MFDDSICHANTIFSLLLWTKHLNPFGYITIVLKWKASSMPSSLVSLCQTKPLHFPAIICLAPPFEKPSSFSMALNSFTISILPFRWDTSRGSRTSNSMDHERFRASRSPDNSGGFLYETWRWCNFLSRCILTIFKCLFELKTTKLNCQVILRKLLIIWKKRSWMWRHFTICTRQELWVLEFDSLFRCKNPILNHCSWWWRHESLQWAAPACLLTAQGNLD